MAEGEVGEGTVSFPGPQSGRLTLVASDAPQEVTEEWELLGVEIGVEGVRTLALWVDVDIGEAEKIQFRLKGKSAAMEDEFGWAAYGASGSEIEVTEATYILDDDQDQKLILLWALNGILPFVRIYTNAQESEGVPAQILSACVITAM